VKNNDLNMVGLSHKAMSIILTII